MAKGAGSYQRINGIDVLLHQTLPPDSPAAASPEGVIASRPPPVNEVRSKRRSERPRQIRPTPGLQGSTKRRRQIVVEDVADIQSTDEQSEERHGQI